MFCRREQGRSLVVGLVASMAIAGCGSTVEWSEITQGGVPLAEAGDEFGEPLPPPTGTEGSESTAPGFEPGDPGGGTGPVTRPSDDGHGTSGPAGPTTPTATNQPDDPSTTSGPSTGPGFTEHEIYIGFAYNSEFEQQAAAAGASVESGDQRVQAQAMADRINAAGGIAGRKIVLVFYDTKGEQNDRQAAAEAACVRFTEDRQVFAAMSAVSQISNDTLYTCLAKSGAVTLAGVLGSGIDARAHLDQYSPSLFMPTGPTVERLVPVWIQRLDHNSYFDGWNVTTGGPGSAEVKVGLLYGANGDASGPIADAMLATVEQELAKQGRALAASFETTGDTNELNQAVIRLRQAGVTHIIGDAALITFLPAAAAQNYRPRYAFSSMSGPALMKLVATPGQLNGALGVGFTPPLDVDNAQDPGDVSPAQGECRQTMDEAGQPTSQRLAWAIMTLTCDAFNFLSMTVERGGLSAEGVRAGMTAMGSMPPAATFAVSFPGGRPDGASAVRDMAYQSNCGCFVYTSNTNQAM